MDSTTRRQRAAQGHFILLAHMSVSPYWQMYAEKDPITAYSDGREGPAQRPWPRGRK